MQAKTGPMAEMRPALFLDRDGVINVDKGYVNRIEDFEWVEGAAETIAAFNRRRLVCFRCDQPVRHCAKLLHRSGHACAA
jgi:hypothetical protein